MPPPPSSLPLCLGGSFNPPHFGHLIVSRAVAERAGFSRVRLIVAGQPPHKPADPALAEAEHRLAMCRLAVADDRFFVVDDREIRRGGPSYTLETARSLQAEPDFAGQPVPWLVGADLLPGLMAWHQPQELLKGQVVRLVVAQRGGRPVDWDSLPPQVRVLRGNVVEAPQIDISASDIRSRIAARRDLRYLVAETVRRYIEEHRLYRG